MPALRELLNPATADQQLAANPPAASGYTEEQVKSVIERRPQNLDTAIGSVAGQQRPPLAPTPPLPLNPSPPLQPKRPSFYDRIDEAFSQFKPKSEDDIIREETDRIQDQINAINSVYDSRVQDAQNQGTNRLGQTRALNIAGGNAFDPMGAANVNRTEDANQDVIDAINAERLAEISNLMAASRGEATRRFESQTDRFIGLANDQVNALSRALGLTLEEENNLRAAAISRAQLTGNFEGDPTLNLREFLADQAYKSGQLALSKEELDANIARARAAGNQVIQGDDGTILIYDSYTGKTSVLGRYPSRTERGGSGVDGVSDSPYENSVYDYLIRQIAGGTLPPLALDPAIARAVENRVKELQDLGRDPFAAPAATTSAPADRVYIPGVDKDLQDRLYERGLEAEIPGLAP